MSVRVHGWDLSLNHSAFVELTDGKLTDFRYVTEVKGCADAGGRRGHRLVLSGKGPQREVERLSWWESFIDGIITERKPEYVGIEDYAFGASDRAHAKGELGGLARLRCWNRGVKFRLHDPQSIKMYAAHNGSASKDDVVESVEERHGLDFTIYNGGLKQTHVGEDLADAFWIAQLVWVEVQLRRGLLQLSDLEHPKEIQVFNRTTKANPVNILGREWLQNPFGGVLKVKK